MDIENQDSSKKTIQNFPKAPVIPRPSNMRSYIITQSAQSGCFEVPVTNEEPQDFQVVELQK